MQRLALRSTQLTAVLLVASVVLIVPGLAGLGASLPLALLLLAAAIALLLARESLASVGRIGWIPFGALGRVAWIGPAVAGVLLLVAGGASPGELQAYGGLCGLFGMLNYFLRPVYGIVYAAGRYVSRAVGGTRGS